MTPSKVRATLKQELERWFRIDEWSIGLPAEIQDEARPTSVGREKPITEFPRFERPLGGLGNNATLCTQLVNYQVIYRLSRTWMYSEVLEIYRSPFEDQINQFCQLLQHSPHKLGFKSAVLSAKISCPELRSGDWLLSATVEASITYETQSPCKPKQLFS